MAIYQIKVKGAEGLSRFRTFLARDVGDVVRQATDEHQVEAIEAVNILLYEDDIDRVVHKLLIRLDGAFTDLQCLVESANDYDPDNFDFAALDLAMDLIKEKTDQIRSTISALHAITSDTPSRFGYKDKSESQRQ